MAGGHPAVMVSFSLVERVWLEAYACFPCKRGIFSHGGLPLIPVLAMIQV